MALLRILFALLLLAALGASNLLEHSVCFCKGYNFAGWARTMSYNDDKSRLSSSWTDTCDAAASTEPFCLKRITINIKTCLSSAQPGVKPDICYHPSWWGPRFTIGGKRTWLSRKQKTTVFRTDCTEQCREYFFGPGRDLVGAPLTSACNFTTGGVDAELELPAQDRLRCRTDTWNV